MFRIFFYNRKIITILYLKLSLNNWKTARKWMVLVLQNFEDGIDDFLVYFFIDYPMFRKNNYDWNAQVRFYIMWMYLFGGIFFMNASLNFYDIFCFKVIFYAKSILKLLINNNKKTRKRQYSSSLHDAITLITFLFSKWRMVRYTTICLHEIVKF